MGHRDLLATSFLYENMDCPDKVNVHAFKNRLKRIIQIEYFIVKKDNTLDKHFKKWKQLRA